MINDTFRALVLGIVEGITEFLPVSSTGHMILVEPLLGIPEKDPFWSGTFDIFIQVGAILAVLLYFWERLWRVVSAQSRRSWGDHFLTKVFVAFLPAAMVGLLAGKLIEAKLKNPPVVAAALIIGGLIIIAIEMVRPRQRFDNAATIPLRCALLIGIAQCLALIPGTSRSAATIMGALLLGLTPAAAAEFSFFLAIPTLTAAGGYKLLKNLHDIHSQQFALLGLGFSTAFVVALLVVAAFMRFIQNNRFTSFAVYRIMLGALVLLLLRHAA